jgi:hypothetical protein
MKPGDVESLKKELSILRQKYDSLEKETGHLRKRYDELKEEYEKLQQYIAGSVQPPRVEYEEAQFIEPGAENDFYTGERKDILLSVLEDALASLKPGSRRRDVVASVIAANGGGEKQRAREKELKAILRGYVSMDASVRTRLQKFGFVINGAGKHYNLVYYGDNRYAYTIAKTAGDGRAGVNAGASIATLVL